ncbi:Protein ESKIMO 1 [Dichanthelium oligosanthes]|uniref:Protein ESKIMO 1 n=1 Tax=Dichanthelium oligosanthes TaxID=888268 RepID=A0A1E5UR48_9POAL|nr:Protein ESKIMO 1 [Dichanthelium oligosanthes]
MQHRRKPASAAAPPATKQPPSRRPTARLSLAGLVVAVFLVATFLYNEDVVVKTGGGADVAVAGGVGVAGRARSPDLRVLQEAAHKHMEEQEEEDAANQKKQEEEEDANQKQQQQQQQQEDANQEESPPQQQHLVVPLPAGCDLYQGRWTFDAAGERSPLYHESECEFLTEQVTCMRNGRRDDSYQKWRWQPHGCDMPRFDASLLLERLRNKRLMFVGDSLNRNQWESMVCMVQSVVPRGQKTLLKFVNNGSLNVFTAHEYNATVEFYWAPFLVQSNSDDPQVHSVMDRVIAWRAIAKHANNWKGVDYLVFNTYIWWLNTFEMKVLKGSGALRNNNNKKGAAWSKYALVDRPVAYREVLKTWAKWVDRHIDPNGTTVFFMGMSPNHITPWAWGNDGGIKCAMETQPIVMSSNRTGPLNIGTDWRLHGVARGVLARYLHRVPVHFVDITGLSELRKDAHTSVHTLRQGKLLTPQQQADPKTYADCIHWCLPGLPDTWNHFLYANIVSAPLRLTTTTSSSPS